jgi:hypothetical protein
MIQIQLEDKVAAALAEQARRKGLTLDRYLAEIAEGNFNSGPNRVSGDEAVALIAAEAGPGNPNYQGSYSREDIYFDHN